MRGTSAISKLVYFETASSSVRDLVAPRCSLDVLKRRAVPKTFLKRGKVSIGYSQGEPFTDRIAAQRAGRRTRGRPSPYDPPGKMPGEGRTIATSKRTRFARLLQ